MTAPLERLERDLEEDPYPSLAHVRTSASGLLRFPDSEGPDGEEGERGLPSCTTLARADSENHSQCRLLPSPYPYWGDEEEDMPSPSQKDPFTGYVLANHSRVNLHLLKLFFSLQKQMKIMNRNLTGKLQELHGIQYEDTHVALSEIRGQLHQLTQR